MTKSIVFVLCLLCAAGAFGQSAAGTPVLQGLVMADHTFRAVPQAIAQERSLLEAPNSVSVSHGEMPLSEVPLPVVQVVPLGDVARSQKKEHNAAKKAQFIWEN